MIFERQIAAQATEPVKGPQFEPGKETHGGTVEVRGGVSKPRDRGHKDWGQLIAHGFELRSLMNTTRYVQAAGGSAALSVGDFGYHIIRAGGQELQITLGKPTGIPANQKTAAGKNRYRQRLAFLEVFYPSDCRLSFGAGFLFGRSGYRQEGGEVVPPVGDEIAPTITPVSLVSMNLDDELARGESDPAEVPNGLRLAGTADLFLVSYNERTGTAFVALLVPGIKGAVDPETPVDDGTEEPTDPEETGPTKPGDGENPYTDPETGEALVKTPPTPTLGTLYALHGGGLSMSADGGATWTFREVPGLGMATDIAAGAGGVFILNINGEVFWAARFDAAFQRLDLSAYNEEGGTELPLKNGDFETGDLTGWTHVDGDMPRVLDTAQPEQRPGSTHYLTRDWRIINTQPFKIEQKIDLPEVPQGGQLVLSFDALTQNNDVAKVSVFDGTEIAAQVDTFPITFNGSQFTASGFANDETGQPLDLVGTVTGTPVGSLSVWGSYPGIRLAGDGNMSASIHWQVKRADGSNYNGLVTLQIFDLDRASGSGFWERLTVDRLVSYDLLASQVQAVPKGTNTTEFIGPVDTPEGNTPTARFNITFRGSCDFLITTYATGAFGIKGPGTGGTPAEPVPIFEAQHIGEEWEEVKVSYQGPLPPRLRVQVEGIPVDGYADVYIDNIRLRSFSSSWASATAIAGTQAGADVYVGTALVSIAGQTQALLEAPLEGVTMAANGGATRVVSDGAAAWIQKGGEWASLSDPGPFASVVSRPFVAVGKHSGGVLGADGNSLGSVTGTAMLAGDSRRRLVVGTTSSGAITAILEAAGQPAPVYKSQPSNVGVGGRRTLPLDIGRYIGWGVGSRDFFWNDQPETAWKLGGALERSIVKIVESR